MSSEEREECAEYTPQDEGLSNPIKLAFGAVIGAAGFVALGYMSIAKAIFAFYMLAALASWLYGAYQKASEPLEFEKEASYDE